MRLLHRQRRLFHIRDGARQKWNGNLSGGQGKVLLGLYLLVRRFYFPCLTRGNIIKFMTLQRLNMRIEKFSLSDDNYYVVMFTHALGRHIAHRLMLHSYLSTVKPGQKPVRPKCLSLF